jgi:hypothetical protein
MMRPPPARIFFFTERMPFLTNFKMRPECSARRLWLVGAAGREFNGSKTVQYTSPFGRPVEPLVYMMTAVSSGQGGIRDSETKEWRY